MKSEVCLGHTNIIYMYYKHTDMIHISTSFLKIIKVNYLLLVIFFLPSFLPLSLSLSLSFFLKIGD